MAAAPIFYATPRLGAITVPATADASLTVPTNVATVIAGVATGTKIEQLRIMQIATTSAAGVLNLFLYNGTTYSLFDQYTYAATTLSTLIENIPVDKYYANLQLPSASWSVITTVTSAAGQSAFKVIAFGGDA